MRKIWLVILASLIASLNPAHASLQTEDSTEQDEYSYQQESAENFENIENTETFDAAAQPDEQTAATWKQSPANAAAVVNNIPPAGGGRVETEEGGGKMSLLEEKRKWDDYAQHRRFLIAQSERSAGVSPDEAGNQFIRESVDRMFREQTEEERMAEQRRRERKEITGGLIVIALSAAYLFWIRRILKSKTAKSVPGEIFRDAATVVGLLFALTLFSEMVYDSIDARHFRSAMFIAVSSAVLPYLCMMYLANGYRRPYSWRAKILYPLTAAMLAYWLMLYAADIADGEGSGNVMASLFGLLLSTAFCIALKIKLTKSKNQQD